MTRCFCFPPAAADEGAWSAGQQLPSMGQQWATQQQAQQQAAYRLVLQQQQQQGQNNVQQQQQQRPAMQGGAMQPQQTAAAMQGGAMQGGAAGGGVAPSSSFPGFQQHEGQYSQQPQGQYNPQLLQGQYGQYEGQQPAAMMAPDAAAALYPQQQELYNPQQLPPQGQPAGTAVPQGMLDAGAPQQQYDQQYPQQYDPQQYQQQQQQYDPQWQQHQAWQAQQAALMQQQQQAQVRRRMGCMGYPPATARMGGGERAHACSCCPESA